jgi:mRNA interferase MazF
LGRALTAREPRRGDVWFADVPGDKRRPVVMLSRDSVLPRLTTILVAPVTTMVRDIPTELRLDRAHGLPRSCVANFDNITPFPRRRWLTAPAASRQSSSARRARRHDSPSTAEPPRRQALPPLSSLLHAEHAKWV